MNPDSSTTYITPYVRQFFDSVCCETSSAVRVLSQLYPDGPKCASCGAEITRKRALETFWRGDRTYCSGCGSKFEPRTGTILSNAQLTYSQFEIICVLLALGIDYKRVSSMSGAHPDTVAIWHAKIKFWESHV